MNLFTKTAGYVSPYISGWAQAIHELGTNLDHGLNSTNKAPHSLIKNFRDQYYQGKNELTDLIERHASRLPDYQGANVKRKLKNFLTLADHISSPHTGYTKSLHGSLLDSMNNLLDTVHNPGRF